MLSRPFSGTAELDRHVMNNPDPLTHPVMDRVRKALGRPAGYGPTPPVPPEIPEHVARLVHSAIGLPELFVKRGRAR
jgi:hypothetical protein